MCVFKNVVFDAEVVYRNFLIEYKLLMLVNCNLNLIKLNVIN